MGMRFKVEPRDVPAEAAARRLGVDLSGFTERLPDLLTRGFPAPDATTGNFDLKAIDAWMDKRSGLGGIAAPAARDAASVVDERIRAMRHG
jgi:hypothetical protein